MRLGRGFGLLCVMMTLVACINDPEDRIEDTLTIGDSIPDFVVEMNDGEIVTGADLRKQPSVIVFFYTGCPDCQQVLPLIQQLYDTYTPQGVRFALISRAETAESIARYWLEQGFTMPYSPQEDRFVYELFAKIRVPRVYVSSSDGVIGHIFTDNPRPTLADIDAAIQMQL